MFDLEVMCDPTAADVRKLDVITVTEHEEVRPRKAPKTPATVPCDKINKFGFDVTVPCDKINKLGFDVADLTASPLISAACGTK